MTQNNFQYSSAAVSDKGLSDKRPQNEDSYLELRDSGLYAVADGVGGAQAGDVASQMAMEILAEAFVNLAEDGDAEERMQIAIQQANGAIFQMSNDLPQLSTMATTVVALHIQDNIATIGHVGDSRLYRLDSDGNLFRETQDHSVVEEEVRAGRLTPEQAAVHPSRNVISRALGAEDSVEIDMKTIMFEPGTTFLACTDGVTLHIADDELKDILSSDEDMFIVCQQIKTLCFERGAEDNLTAVVVKVSEEQVEDFESVVELDGQIEEETVASVRKPLVNSSIISNAKSSNEQTIDESEPLLDVLEVEELPNSTQDDDQPIVIETEESEIDSIKIQAEESKELSIQAKPESESKEVRIEQDNVIDTAKNDVRAYKVDEDSGDGLVGKLISGLLWLLIGGLLGAVLTYLWLSGSNSTNEIPNTSAPQADISLTSFETNRRNADVNPSQLIANNNNPQDAEDYYLIGRAYLNMRNYELAKKNFEIAKEKLSEANETNRKVIETDLAAGFAVINDPFAQKTFEKELGLSENSENNTNGSNSN